jgi:hypothetical protein
MFGVNVLVSAVSAVVVGELTLSASAAQHLCSRQSVRRWIDWVEGLSEVDDLLRACTRLDSDGMPGGWVSKTIRPAAAIVHLLDRLAELVVSRGGSLQRRGCGLSDILGDQLRRFGTVFYMTRPSPRLSGDSLFWSD